MRIARYVTVLLASVVVASVLAAPPQRLELSVKQFPAQLDLENLGAEFPATVIIVAHTDRASRPVRLLKGVTINGTRVAERLLTGSVLKIGSDGKGLYGYTAGFGVPVTPQIADPTHRAMDEEKNAWDPVRGAMDGRYPWMLVTVAGAPRRTTYELSFPNPIAIRKVTAQASCDGPPEGIAAVTQVHSDPDGKQVLAEKSFTRDGGQRFPHIFDGVDTNHLYLTFTGRGGKETSLFYNATFWAELDCSKLPKVVVSKGRNTLNVADDENSSHLGRVLVEGFAKDGLPKPPPPSDPLANYVSPHANKKPAKPAMIRDPREFFPRGFYWGPGCPHWDFVLDDMKAHHMNCIYGSNWWPEALEKFLPMAERAGIRVIYQGTSWGALYYFTYQPEEQRKVGYEGELVPSFKRLVEKVKASPSLLLWSLTEEIAPGTAADLTRYYEMVRGSDPNHPPTVLHNSIAAAKEDLTINKPLVVTTDIYPFFLDPRSGPSNPGRSLQYYAGRFEELYKLCRGTDAAMWAMPQAWGAEPDDSFDPPFFGPVGGMRKPTAAMMKLQAWVAVLKGATGVMYFAYIGSSPTESHLRHSDWSEAEQMKGATEVFAQLGKVAGLLVRLERDYADASFIASSDPAVWVHTFKSKTKYGLRARYAVVANTDWEKAHTFQLNLTAGAPDTKGIVFDAINGKPIPEAMLSAMTLQPGDGMVLAFGSKADVARDLKIAAAVE